MRRRNHPGRLVSLERRLPVVELATRDADERDYRAWALSWLLAITPGVQTPPVMPAGAARHEARLLARRKQPTHEDAVRALMKAVPPSRGAP